MAAVHTKDQTHRQGEAEAGRARKGQDGAAESVGRDPDQDAAPDEKAPEDKTPAVSREDEPRGQPTSDRFHSEQAHKSTRDKA